MTRPADDVNIAFQIGDSERIRRTAEVMADLESRAEVALGQLRLGAAPDALDAAGWLLDLTRFPSADNSRNWYCRCLDMSNAMRVDLGRRPRRGGWRSL